MAIQKRHCTHHPERLAIGVCVITKEPICAECSTRYEGVNYSKEGLRILQARRAAKTQGRQRRLQPMTLFAAVISPLLFFLLYAFYHRAFMLLIDLQQMMMEGG